MPYCHECKQAQRREVLAAEAEFDVVDLTSLDQFDIDEGLAEDILERIERGASIQEIGDLLGVEVTGQRHPLAQKNPLFYFLDTHTDFHRNTIMYFPDEDTFYINSPGELYGEEDGALVNQYLEDMFGDGVEFELDLGFELLCDGRRVDELTDELLADLDGAMFDAGPGTFELRRCEIADIEKMRDDAEVYGGCTGNVTIPGEAAIEALYDFYDGDLYADARAKQRDEIEGFFRDTSEHSVKRVIKEELNQYCDTVEYIDVVG